MVIGSDANQLGSSIVREWDRAVGLSLGDAVVLAAHRLETLNETDELKDTLVCAMTGEQPVSAEKALRALTGKVKELVEEGGPMLTVKKAAEFVPAFSNQIKNEYLIEFLAVGLDWDELRRKFVPCLFYATTSGSVKTDAYATGLGSIYSQSVLDMLFKKQMPIEEAIDVALRAIYSAAFCNEVKGQAVEAVDVCVITAESITRVRHDIKDLHAKYAPMLKEREEELLRNPVPRYEYTVSDSEDEDW